MDYFRVWFDPAPYIRKNLTGNDKSAYTKGFWQECFDTQIDVSFYGQTKERGRTYFQLVTKAGTFIYHHWCRADDPKAFRVWLKTQAVIKRLSEQ